MRSLRQRYGWCYRTSATRCDSARASTIAQAAEHSTQTGLELRVDRTGAGRRAQRDEVDGGLCAFPSAVGDFLNRDGPSPDDYELPEWERNLLVWWFPTGATRRRRR